MASSTLSTVWLVSLHTIATVAFAYGMYFDVILLGESPEAKQFRAAHGDHTAGFGGRLKYLTFWDMIIQLVFFGVALLSDLIGNSEKAPGRVQKLRDAIFATAALPIGMFVTMMFWSIWAIDRELIFPTALDSFFPVWLNHIMHTSPLVLCCLEMASTNHKFPSRIKGLSATAFLISSYIVWTLIIASVSGEWVYPIMKAMNWWQNTVFIIGCALCSAALYLIGETINCAVWGKFTTSKASTHKTRQTDTKAKKKRKTN